MDFDDGPDAQNIYFYIYKDQNGKFAKRDDESLPSTVVKLFLELNNALMKSSGSRFGSCELIIDADGTYTFKFDYAKSRRLFGDLDEENYWRYSRYAETYAAEQAAS